jgi:hypothetical protein
MQQIIFTFEHPIYGSFTDAIYLEENHGLSDAEIDAMKQARFDAWVAHIETSNEAV